MSEFSTKLCRMILQHKKADSDKIAEWPRRIVSGLQPTGELHVGNYFGALRRCVRLQDQGDEVMLFIADLHSFTSRQVLLLYFYF